MPANCIKNNFYAVCLLGVCCLKTAGQDAFTDSLKLLARSASNDTVKVTALLFAGWNNVFNHPDTALLYAQKGLKLSQRNGYKPGIATAYIVLGRTGGQLGSYPKAINLCSKALNIFTQINMLPGVLFSKNALGTLYRDEGDAPQALKYLLSNQQTIMGLSQNDLIAPGFIFNTKNNWLMYGYADMAGAYLLAQAPDSAINRAKKALAFAGGYFNYPKLTIAGAFALKNQNDSALYYYRQLFYPGSYASPNDIAEACTGMASVFKKMQLGDSCVHYAKLALAASGKVNYQKGILNASELLAGVYEKSNPAEAIKYFKLYKVTNDSLFSKEKQREVDAYNFNEQLHDIELQAQRERQQSNLKIYALLAFLVFFGLVLSLVYLNSVNRQKAYKNLEKQKQETDFQKAKAEDALAGLKSAQSRLIQSEKLASLGELTAGIAHEIQNPLNFVNNFSEVNTELLLELKDEINKGNNEEANAIANDVIANEQKINYHGKRADAIVKGMLQHSRKSTGQKELIDINALADECLRLSYHGLRAKDKTFNAQMVTNFDAGLPKISVIPQDVGRVLLNLFNNAFYAVTEKVPPRPPKGGAAYQPTVSVSTKLIKPPLGPARAGTDGGLGVAITVADNGNGIPQTIIDKIFQPFFTTKPTGQGTGLGLSLSYDIVKAHGGEIRVETKEGEGTEFIVTFPIA